MNTAQLASPCRRIAGVSLGLAAALALASPASAISPEEGLVDNLVVNANDGMSLARCTLTVKSVDYAAGTVRVQLAGQSRPTSLAGYFDNAHVAVTCAVAGTSAVLHGEGNTGVALLRATYTVPYAPDYTLCASVQTTGRDGDTVAAGPVCAS